MLRNNRSCLPVRSRGFTLIEAMVVVSILSILLALGVPGLSEWIAKSRVRSGVEDLQNAIKLAQSEAAKQNQNVEFALIASQPLPAGGVLNTDAADNSTYWTVRALPQGTTDKTFVQGGDFGSRGVKITGGSTLIFSGLGRVLTNTTPTYLTTTRVYRVESKNNKYPICVFVRPGGGVRWCDPGVPSGSVIGCPSDATC